MKKQIKMQSTFENILQRHSIIFTAKREDAEKLLSRVNIKRETYLFGDELVYNLGSLNSYNTWMLVYDDVDSKLASLISASNRRSFIILDTHEVIDYAKSYAAVSSLQSKLHSLGSAVSVLYI